MSKKPILVIFLTVFIDLVGFGIIIPLSPYLARTYGASPFEVGLLMAVYSGMQFIFSPIWGALSDRIGRRPVLLISIAGTAVAHMCFYFAPTYLFLILARTFAGLFSANISTAMAYIADVTSAKDRSKSMGLIGAAFGLGFIFGPAIGGWTSGVSEHFPALVAALISVLNFVLALFILKESLAPEHRRIREKKSRIKNIIDKMSRPVLGALFFAQFASALAMANMEASLFLYVQDRFGWNMQKASYGFAYVGVCIAMTQGFLVRKFLPRFGERRTLFWGLFFFAIGMTFIGFSMSVTWLTVAMTSLAIGSGLANPALSGSLSLLSSAQEQGEIIGVNHSLAALARILGPPLGGFLYMHVAMSAPFVLAGGLGFCALVIIWFERHKLPNAGLQQQH